MRFGKLPAYFKPGGPFVATVSLMTPAEMKRFFEDEEVPEAAWIDDHDLIVVDASLSREAQWEAYFHECMHALHDFSERYRDLRKLQAMKKGEK